MPDSEPKRVVVATGNPGKLTEIRAALALPGWVFVSVAELGEPPVVEETGATFAENALLKAQAYRDTFGLPALADDSGLEVDVLDGAPGVRSSRYAGEHASDAENNRLLQENLAGFGLEQRTARFRSAVALVDDDGAVVTAEGTCEGRIAFEPHGDGGFGYDPLFLPDDAPGRTMAELALEEKNAISHRGTALRALAVLLADR